MDNFVKAEDLLQYPLDTEYKRVKEFMEVIEAVKGSISYASLYTQCGFEHVVWSLRGYSDQFKVREYACEVIKDMLFILDTKYSEIEKISINNVFEASHLYAKKETDENFLNIIRDISWRSLGYQELDILYTLALPSASSSEISDIILIAITYLSVKAQDNVAEKMKQEALFLKFFG